MKKIFILCLATIVFWSCSNQTRNKKEIENKPEMVETGDTIIVAENITNELAGSASRKRATGYYVIVNNDTSEFMPIFTESKEGNKIGINLNLPYSKETETHGQRLKELSLILKEASKEYNIYSLKGMSIGRLILTGDLAIAITEEFKNKFGDKYQISTKDYNEISTFLLESSLTEDFNELFEPYSISVEKVSIEKAFFTNKEELLRYSNESRDSVEIPDRIIDFMTWIEFTHE